MFLPDAGKARDGILLTLRLPGEQSRERVEPIASIRNVGDRPVSFFIGVGEGPVFQVRNQAVALPP